MAHVRRPSPATVIACVALGIALGGTGYAAIVLPKNSVGTAQLKADAVNSSKVKNGSLLNADFKAGEAPAGPAGAAGAAGTAGPAGPAGPFVDALPSGKTIRGAFDIRGLAVGGGHLESTALSFDFALAAVPTVHFVPQGSAPPAECTGNAAFPQANGGHLCIYESAHSNAGGGQVLEVTRSGATIYILAVAGGSLSSRGTWAVTAP